MRAKGFRSAVIAAALSVVLCVGMLAGTTFAWFTDTVTSAGNIIAAGSLDAGLFYAEGWNGEDTAWQDASEGAIFDSDDWAPGETEIRYIKATNEGDIAFRYRLDVVPEGDAGTLAEVIDVYFGVIGEGFSAPADFAAAQQSLTKVGTLAELMAENDGIAHGVLLPAGAEEAAGAEVGEVAACVVLHMQESAGNEYQGAFVGEGGFAVVLKAAQNVEGAENELKTGVAVSGLAGMEGQTFATVEEAYEAGRQILLAAGADDGDTLGQGPISDDEEFDALYTDGGILTWTIYGEQTLNEGVRYLTFGRASNRYSSRRSVTEINVVGGNSGARLELGDVALPYAWWNDAEDALTVTFSGLELVSLRADEDIRCSRAYGAPLNVAFDGCDIQGRIYHYFNGEGSIAVSNCNFTDDGNVGYAFFVQGSETDPLNIVFTGNTVTGYTRGINIQQRTAVVTVTGNVIRSTNNEPDRGALQLTDCATALVENNVIDVNAGNALWFHEAAKNTEVQYTIRGNTFIAPYLANDDTSFGIQSHIVSSGNDVTGITYPGMCMEKEATEASESTVTLG